MLALDTFIPLDMPLKNVIQTQLFQLLGYQDCQSSITQRDFQ
jgi:hypothetical protein